MTQEEKAKAYDELLVKLQEAKVDDNVCDERYCCVIDEIVPELKESEDEKMANIIREALANVTSENTLGKYGLSHSDVSDWLEKLSVQKAKYHDVCDKCTRQPTCQSDCFLQQGEQKPAWSEEDEGLLYWTVNNLEEIKSKYGGGYGKVSKCRNWVLSFKDRVQPQPKQEWNSGDDAHFHSLITHLEDFIASHPNTTGADIQGENIAWLESLKDRYTWKPSDEQMQILHWCMPLWVEPKSKAILESLINDLKKLREE